MSASSLAILLYLVLVQTAGSTTPAPDPKDPAPITGLVVFLPVVSAFLGAIIGAWANSLYREKEAKKARDRERTALLLLIDAEVFSHIRMINAAAKNQAAAAQGQKASLNTDIQNVRNRFLTPRTEDWDRAKERLAQLLPADHMKAVIIYYKALKDTVDLTSYDETMKFRMKALADLQQVAAKFRSILIEERGYTWFCESIEVL